MILEVATLNVKMGQEAQFEAAFGRAQGIICSMKAISHISYKNAWNTQIDTCCLSNGKRWKITLKDFVILHRIKIGKGFCIISTIHYQGLSTMKWCIPIHVRNHHGEGRNEPVRQCRRKAFRS